MLGWAGEHSGDTGAQTGGTGAPAGRHAGSEGGAAVDAGSLGPKQARTLFEQAARKRRGEKWRLDRR